MRAIVDGFEIEGTPDEIAAFMRVHRTYPINSLDKSQNIELENEFEDHRFASEKIAFKAFQRRPMSAAQRVLFRTLLAEYPEWVSASDLQKATDYGPNQLGGLLGGIGRRLSTTPGYVLGSSLIEWMWDADSSGYMYRLPPSVASALRRIDP